MAVLLVGGGIGVVSLLINLFLSGEVGLCWLFRVRRQCLVVSLRCCSLLGRNEQSAFRRLVCHNATHPFPWEREGWGRLGVSDVAGENPVLPRFRGVGQSFLGAAVVRAGCGILSRFRGARSGPAGFPVGVIGEAKNFRSAPDGFAGHLKRRPIDQDWYVAQKLSQLACFLLGTGSGECASFWALCGPADCDASWWRSFISSSRMTQRNLAMQRTST